MFVEALPPRLKHKREELGLSQAEVAKEIGVGRSTLSKYELGQREPDIETLGKLAMFYDVSIDWLFGIGRSKPVDISEIKEREKILKDLEKTAKKESKKAAN